MATIAEAKISEVVQVGPGHVSDGMLRNLLVDVARWFRDQDLIIGLETGVDDEMISRLEDNQPDMQIYIRRRLAELGVTP